MIGAFFVVIGNLVCDITMCCCNYRASITLRQEHKVSLKYKVIGKTHVGLVRSGNEDYLHLDKPSSVFAVCDGMGGHQAGEVASMLASETMLRAFHHLQQKLLSHPDLALNLSLPQTGELLVKSIRLANREIYNSSTNDIKLTGMGTTVVSVALDGDMMSIAHVGDSRAYRLEERLLKPLTTDHSWVSEMREKQLSQDMEDLGSMGKNVITRALGVRENVEVDYRLIKIKPGDIFMLCSDGLCGFADDEEIFNVADSTRNDLVRMCDNLVQMANDRGGADNITVIVLEIEETEAKQYDEINVVTFPGESPELLQVEDLLLEEMKQYQVESDPASDEEVSRPLGSKLLLSFIFATFVVIAAVMIYLSVIR